MRGRGKTRSASSSAVHASSDRGPEDRQHPRLATGSDLNSTRTSCASTLLALSTILVANRMICRRYPESSQDIAVDGMTKTNEDSRDTELTSDPNRAAEVVRTLGGKGTFEYPTKILV